MASKTGQETLSVEAIEEALDAVEQTLDRLKTLYEQYFLGIQKQAPAFLHTDVERKLRDLTQVNIRNTGLRFRLATIQQKFGSYNSYWRRTLRQIESGTYLRNLAKIGRDAAKNGTEIPEEILAAMPKRMREQVVRDRDAALAIAKRRRQPEDGTGEAGVIALGDEGNEPPEVDDVAAMISEPSVLKRELKTKSGAHVISEADGEMDYDAFFSAFDDDAPKFEKKPVTQPTAPPPVTQPTAPPPVIQPIATPITATPTPGPPASVAPRPSVPAPAATPGPPTTPIPRPPTGVTPLRPFTIPAIPKVIPPSQASRPNPIAPGSASKTGPVGVESMSGPFPRPQTPPAPPPPAAQPPPRPQVPPPAARPTPTALKPPAAARPTPTALKPPPGMTEDDVNALHAKYVKAKEMIGEKVDASSRDKLLKTITQTAPKIMEQYKASGVDFSVVVKDNQVVIKAKPKT